MNPVILTYDIQKRELTIIIEDTRLIIPNFNEKHSIILTPLAQGKLIKRLVENMELEGVPLHFLRQI